MTPPPERKPDVTRRPLPEDVVEQLAELWCEALLANLRRHPIEPPMRKAS